jgi:hypothetical protein
LASIEVVREIEPADQAADHRHDQVLDDRIDDLAEGRADDDADRQVDDIPLHRERLEFGGESHVMLLFFWMLRGSIAEQCQKSSRKPRQ